MLHHLLNLNRQSQLRRGFCAQDQDGSKKKKKKRKLLLSYFKRCRFFSRLLPQWHDTCIYDTSRPGVRDMRFKYFAQVKWFVLPQNPRLGIYEIKSRYLQENLHNSHQVFKNLLCVIGALGTMPNTILQWLTTIATVAKSNDFKFY